MNIAFTALMDDFGKFIDVPTLEPDEDGSYYLIFDDLVVSVSLATLFSPPEECLLLQSCVGVLPFTQREQACLHLLQANNLFAGTDGATLSVEKDSFLVSLQRTTSIASLELTRFVQLLESFVQQTEYWTHFCANALPPPEATTQSHALASKNLHTSALV